MRRILIFAVLGLALAPALSFGNDYPAPALGSAGPTVTLQSGATTGSGTAIDFKGKVKLITIYIQWHAACTGGAVVIDTADTSGYAGTWAVLTTQTYAAGTQVVVNIVAPLNAIRARISPNVTGTGASVSVYAKGANL